MRAAVRLALMLLVLCGLTVFITCRDRGSDSLARSAERSVPGESVRPGFTVIAHRGNSSVAPENTLASIRSALELGCRMIELDIYLSRDGVPVVFHDDTVDRRTDGTGKISELTLEQLRALDAGSWKGPQYAGERIPTLAEALEAVRGQAQLFLDLKVEGLAGPVAAVIGELGLSDESVTLAPWTMTQVRDFAQQLPGAPIMLTTGSLPAEWDAGYFAGLRAEGVDGFDIGDLQNAALPAFVRDAQAHGMRVFVFTVNDEPEMRRLIGIGVDGIETDNPAALLRIVRELETR